MMDYHQIATSRMCAVGQYLRMQVYNMAVRIRSEAWMRDGVTPLERANMLQTARDAANAAYSDAFAAWREHYRNCQTCQDALRP